MDGDTAISFLSLRFLDVSERLIFRAVMTIVIKHTVPTMKVNIRTTRLMTSWEGGEMWSYQEGGRGNVAISGGRKGECCHIRREEGGMLP